MRVQILDVSVDVLPLTGVLRLVDLFVESTRPRQIITANALMILAADESAGLRQAFDNADLVVPDSAGVALAARLAGNPISEKISGIDLMESLCQRAAQKGWNVFLLGAAPGVAKSASEALQARYPNLRIVGVQHGFFSLAEEDQVLKQVAQSEPHLLFVALDVPRQDAWIHSNKPRLGAKVAMGVGGSFDVLSGKLKRAPAWMRTAGLEWLFRLYQEPKRAKRMVRLPAFLWKTVARKISVRLP